MSGLYLEILRAVVIIGILLLLIGWKSKSSLFETPRYRFVFSGFALLTIAVALDVADGVDSLRRYVDIGNTFEEILLIEGSCYIGGFVLLLFGFHGLFALDKLRMSESKIERQDNLYQSLFDSANDAIFLMKGEYFTDCNQKTLEMFGCERDDIVGNTPAAFSPPNQPDGTPSSEKAIKKITATLCEKPQIFEWRHTRLDGTPFDAEVSLSALHIDGETTLQAIVRDITNRKRTDSAIRDIAEGVSAASGQLVLDNLIESIKRYFDADHAFLGLLDEHKVDRIYVASVSSNVEIVENISYEVKDTPCENVVGKETCFYMTGIQEEFPKDQMLVDMDIDSYIGTPLFDSEGEPIGLITVLNHKPMVFDENSEAVMSIFASRASAEIERLNAEMHMREAQRKLKLHVDQTPLGVIEWDTNFAVEQWNPSAERIFGFSRNEAIGRQAKDLIIPEEIHPYIDEIWQALLTNKGGERSDNENITKDGSTIVCEWYNTPLVSEDGSVIGVTSLVNDITEREQAQNELESYKEGLEETVKERTKDLEAANKELAAFSYSVSHDLRAPLRAIDGFSEALLEDYGDRLDDEGRDYLNRVRGGAQRMSELIEDMLMLSRVTRRELNVEEINLSKIVNKIITHKQEHEPERVVEFVIQDDVHVNGDAHLMSVVMENLLGNAWKYTAKTESPRIEFGCTEKDSQTVCYVKDNGAGFDMRYADKLFSPFQRLHKVEDFPGLGIGLATVQRIARRHGGDVWAEAEEDKGATFFLMLP